MQKAINAVNGKCLTVHAAATKFHVPRSTLSDKVSGIHPQPSGGQLVLSDDAEIVIANNITILADWGFPLSLFDLRMLVKNFINRQGLKILQFSVNNLPGKE